MRHHIPIAGFAVALLALSALLLQTNSATRLVDDDGSAEFSSIQAAIDAASPGLDDVFVRCGDYVENLVMRDGVSVEGERAECTILHPATAAEPTVTMASLGADTSFGGFTVRNLGSPFLGSSGIRVDLGMPVVTENIVEGPGASSPSYSGPGIEVHGGAPVISYNIIKGNSACCYGGGVLLNGSNAAVRSNVIVGNAAYYGAGLLTEYGSPTITNNTILDNEGWVGGGLMVSGVDPVTLVGNLIAFNSAVIYGGGVVEWSSGGGPFEENAFFDNLPDEIVGPRNPIGQFGNILADPRLLDRSRSSFSGFQPRSDSPLIDSGPPRERDLRGIVGAVDGDVDGLSVGDIGARENEGVTALLHTGSRFVWDAGRNQPPRYNVYRGDLAVLASTGVYTQDPLLVEGAARFCDVGNELEDTELPFAGRGFFYLPVERGDVEGTLGFDSAPLERPKEPPGCGSP